MTGEGIYVDHAQLDNARTDLENAAKKIQDRLESLEGQLKPLRERWSGQAKESYDGAKATWDSAINDMVIALQTHGQLVRDANDGYNDADKGASKYFDF